ncbi:MAG: response regulator [Pseudomonadota bacterium]
MKMSCLARFALLCCLTLPGLTAHARSAPTFAVDNAANRLEIAPWLDTLPPRLATLSTAELLTKVDDWPWQALNQPVLAQGHLRHGIWLRLKIRNDGLEQRRVIEFARANLNHIEVITRQSNGSWLIRHAGAAELSPRGDTTGLGYSFSLNIPEGSSAVYLHVQSAYPLATAIRLSSENGLFKALQNSAGLFGAGLGLLGGMIIGMAGLRSAHLSLSARWAYVFIILMVIAQAMLDRGVLGYWWLDVPGSLNGMIELSAGMLCIAHMLLCRQFLAQRKAPADCLQRLLPAMILANLLWMLTAVTWLPNQWSLAADVLRWSSYAAIIAALWKPAREGLKGAKLYVGTMIIGLASQLFGDAGLHGILPFVAEPYQILMLWHLLALPVLLHLLEREPTEGQPERRAETDSKRQALHSPATLSATSPPASAPAITRILIVEDNPWVQQVLAGLLLKLNCQTSLAGNGREALQYLAAETFDLVLMDCDLPELDGFSTTQLWRAQTQLSAQASNPKVPIIAITAHISASHRMQAQEAGMDDFLQKPIDMRTLHDVLMRWLPHYTAKT